MSRPAWLPVYLGLGSNLDDPLRHLDRAADEIGRLPDTRLVAVSGFYRNPPFGPVPQPDFVNAAAGLLTRLPALELLARLKQIERAHGRVPGEGPRWGPRVIDLDLLVLGRRQIESAELTVPHPGIAERNFVLFPLLEIAPGLDVPGLGPLRRLVAKADRAGLQRLGG